MSPESPDRDGSPGSSSTWAVERARPGGSWWMDRRPDPPRDRPVSDAAPMSPDAGEGTVDNGNGLMAIGLAVIGVVVLVLSVHFFPSPRLSRVLVPVTGLCATIGIGARLARKHPEEPWLGRWLVLAVIAKEIASIARYRTLVKAYGDVGDATVFDQYGRRFLAAWLHKAGAVEPTLTDLRKSNFLRWFAGVVYFLFGQDMIAGFIVFALIAFVGSYLWYRAAVEALPFLDRRLFFLLVFFAPSISFWPSSIGKEALMQFGIGSAALGTAHLFKGRLVRGLAVAVPGAWLMWVIRPHLLALVTLAAAGAYLVGKSPRRAKSSVAQSSLVKPIGLLVVGFIAVFAVSQGAKSLGLPSLTLGSVQAELDKTTISTGQGHSSFNNGGNSLSPLHLPQGAITVLLRPFPWEVSSVLQILASLEGIALAGFMVYRRKSISLSLRRLRSSPFLFYCWSLTLLYAVTFQAFANFGLLVRERSLVLPALYVLLCLDHTRVDADGEAVPASPSTSGANSVVA